MSGFTVKFVRRKSVQSDHLLKASIEVEEAELPIEWISEEEAGQLTQKDKCIYICDPFEGSTFDYINNLGCRIIGPQCVLSCLTLKIPIPKTDTAVYTIAMRNVVVSCSNIAKKQREVIHKYVQWMGGRVSRNFTETVTHLVTGEVGSKKYHVAANLKKCIMLPDWVYTVWEDGKYKHVDATSAEFDRYKCPIFKGCIICVTGMDKDERREVKRLTEEHGGSYTGELKFNKCTHLIVCTLKGQKYDFARRWKIHCISLKWFKDSLQKGVSQDEVLYNVEHTDGEHDESCTTSTPNEKASVATLSPRSVADVSAISTLNQSAVNETLMTTMNVTAITDQVKCDDGLGTLDLFKPQEDYLDACKIYLSGFCGNRLEKVRKIINIGGGTRFRQLTENVTHVIVETGTKDYVELVTSSDFKPHVVTVAWLVEGFKQGAMVSEQPYSCLDVSADAETPTKDKFSIHQSNASRKSMFTDEQGECEDDQDDDIMLQYLHNPCNDVEENKEITKIGNDEHTEEEEDDATQIEQDFENEDKPEHEEVEEVNGIFSKKTFAVFEFTSDQEEEIQVMISEEGGQIVPNNSSDTDYNIVPITGCEAVSNLHNVATNCWLQMCIESGQLFDLASNPLFRPVILDEEKRPLEGCVVSISQFIGVERDCLLHLAELLGATCQEYFVRKAKNNLEANTHLLLKEPEGSKYQAAKKWNIPAVHRRWLLECIKRSQHVSEEKYLIDNLGDDSTLLSNSMETTEVSMATGNEPIKCTDAETDEEVIKQGGNADQLLKTKKKKVPTATLR